VLSSSRCYPRANIPVPLSPCRYPRAVMHTIAPECTDRRSASVWRPFNASLFPTIPCSYEAPPSSLCQPYRSLLRSVVHPLPSIPILRTFDRKSNLFTTTNTDLYRRNADDLKLLLVSRPRPYPSRCRNMGNKVVHFIPTRLCAST
jgi:hypothetical protein